MTHEARFLAHAYGRYSTGGCLMTIDTGPKVDVLELLAVREDVRARRAVVAYVKDLAASRFLFDREATKDNRERLIEIVRAAMLDPDRITRDDALDALALLEGGTPDESGEDYAEPG